MIRLVFWLAMLLAIVLLALAALFTANALLDNQCKAKGGHLHGVYKGWICISDDGRVIE